MLKLKIAKFFTKWSHMSLIEKVEQPNLITLILCYIKNLFVGFAPEDNTWKVWKAKLI